jgi:enoyl-[acyl-carrier-protein] reductase (NADH)
MAANQLEQFPNGSAELHMFERNIDVQLEHSIDFACNDSKVAVAKRLAKDGFDLMVHYAGNPAKAEELVRDIKGAGAQAIAAKADVAVAAEVDGLFSASLSEFENISVVVHAAGIMPLFPISSGDVESVAIIPKKVTRVLSSHGPATHP